MTDQEINVAVARKLGFADGMKHETYFSDILKKIVVRLHTPDYFHSIEAAWEVIEAMLRKKIHFEIHAVYGSEIGWGVAVYDDAGHRIYPPRVSNEFVFNSAPMAICMAFLKLPE